MVREFSLINENNEEFSLMDIHNYCLLTDPEGLGYSYSNTYGQIANKFINVLKVINQGAFSGQVNFINYDNYFKLVNFIEKSEKLKLKYTVPYNTMEPVTYYRNIDMASITKTQIQENGILSETLDLEFISLWYITESTEYEIGDQEDEIRWDFRWNSRFLSNNSNAIDYINNGHAPARVTIEIEGYVVNPTFIVEQGANRLYELPINVTIDIGEKLLFSSLENDFYIKKINMITGVETNLFTLDNIDFNKDYILTLPKGESMFTIETDDILNQATVNIYSYYKAT